MPEPKKKLLAPYTDANGVHHDFYTAPSGQRYEYKYRGDLPPSLDHIKQSVANQTMTNLKGAVSNSPIGGAFEKAAKSYTPSPGAATQPSAVSLGKQTLTDHLRALFTSPEASAAVATRGTPYDELRRDPNQIPMAPGAPLRPAVPYSGTYTDPYDAVSNKVISTVTNPIKNAVQGAVAERLGKYDASAAARNPSTNPLVNAGRMVPYLTQFDPGAAKSGINAVVNDSGGDAIGKVVPDLAPNTLGGAAYNVGTSIGLDPFGLAGAAGEASQAASTARGLEALGVGKIKPVIPAPASMVGQGIETLDDVARAAMTKQALSGAATKGEDAAKGASAVSVAAKAGEPRALPAPLKAGEKVDFGNGQTAENLGKQVNADGELETVIKVTDTARAEEGPATGAGVAADAAALKRPEIAAVDRAKWGDISPEVLSSHFPDGEVPLPNGPELMYRGKLPNGEVGNVWKLGTKDGDTTIVAYGDENLPAEVQAALAKQKPAVLPAGTTQLSPESAAKSPSATNESGTTPLSPDYAIEPGDESEITHHSQVQPRDETGQFVPVDNATPVPAPAPNPRPVPPGTPPTVPPTRPTPRPPTVNTGVPADPPKVFRTPAGFTEPPASKLGMNPTGGAPFTEPAIQPSRPVASAAPLIDSTSVTPRSSATGVTAPVAKPPVAAPPVVPTGTTGVVKPPVVRADSGTPGYVMRPVQGARPGIASKVSALAGRTGAVVDDAVGRVVGRVGAAVDKLPPGVKTAGSKVLSIYDYASGNLKAIRQALDLGATLGRGAHMGVTRPQQFTAAMIAQYKAAWSEEGAAKVMQEIANRPNAKLYEDTGLYVPTAKNADQLYAREEAFARQNLEDIPGVGKFFKASDRGYSAFVGRFRADIFDNTARAWMAKGITPENSFEEYKALGSWINTATGRGDLGAAEKAAPLLNRVINGPRLQAARVAVLNPLTYIKMPPNTRTLALRDSLTYFASAYAMSKMWEQYKHRHPNANVSSSTNPKSSDFLKVRIGDSTVDFTQGDASWARLMAQIISGESIDPSGKKHAVKPVSLATTGPNRYRGGALGMAAEAHMDPILSTAWQMARGTNFYGQDTPAMETAVNAFVPMISDDYKNLIRVHGHGLGDGLALLSFHGAGVNTKPEPVRPDESKETREPLPSEKLATPKPKKTTRKDGSEIYNDADF